jgi:hypothetical protein
MAKKQTRRSISVSRGTYERLKAFCETQGISMSQFVESRVGDYLGRSDSGGRSDLGSRSDVGSRPDIGRLESIAKPTPVKVVVKEERPKDPDIKLTADQIFTF